MEAEYDAIDTFGQLITRRLRDRAIERYEKMTRSEWKSPALLELQSKVAKLDPALQSLFIQCLKECMDSAIHDFLFTVQEGGYEGHDLAFLVDGRDVNELSDGIHGEIFGLDGWFGRFSEYGANGDFYR